MMPFALVPFSKGRCSSDRTSDAIVRTKVGHAIPMQPFVCKFGSANAACVASVDY